MKTILTAAAVLAVTAASAYAQAKPPVPEIDAGAGMAAVAALGASVALLWERRRRN